LNLLILQSKLFEQFIGALQSHWPWLPFSQKIAGANKLLINYDQKEIHFLDDLELNQKS